jgi:hypothetical protein
MSKREQDDELSDEDIADRTSAKATVTVQHLMDKFAGNINSVVTNYDFCFLVRLSQYIFQNWA